MTFYYANRADCYVASTAGFVIREVSADIPADSA